MIGKLELFTCSCSVLSDCFNIEDLCSLPLCFFTISEIRIPIPPTYFFSHNSLGHFTSYTRSYWWLNLLYSLIVKQVLRFLPVYAIWVLAVSASSLCTVFLIHFIILWVLSPLYGKSRKCILLFGTSSCDELVDNCCWCFSCSYWWFFCLVLQKSLLISQNRYWLCSWETFLMWLNSFSKCSFVEQISNDFLTNVQVVPIFDLFGARDIKLS